jgi:aconitate hydratase
MAPEYGATMGFFPVDDRTLEYCRMTGRSEELIDTIERYTKENYLWRTDQETAEYGATLELDLGSVQPSLAGPKRPQDRILLSDMKGAFAKALTADTKSRGFGLKPEHLEATSIVADSKAKLKHGSVVLAAITSCTNTSNPYVLVGAGLLAKKAVEHGLQVPPYVKTSLAPGSRVVTSYLEKLGLDQYLEKLGFFTVGYGCTTCIGNSGPLPDPVREAIHKEDLVVASVLSGNRNFEGRISPDIKANFLASPPLVVAYAIAGTVIKDLSKDPIGTDPDGNAVYLQDIWPSAAEVEEAVKKAITPQMFTEQYQNVFQQNELWNAIPSNESDLYDWDEHSTYVQNPPFFTGMSLNATPIQPLQDLRVLAKLGDSVTTDHISPAGVINADSPAGRYLLEKGVSIEQFNSYGSRRGNDRIMTRGTFANIRLRNHLANGKEGGFTKNFLDQQITSIYEASVAYKTQGIGLMVIGGKEYGTGSSRDWAAKGTFLLGVKAVLAESFERIHRSNLVGMGVLPLQFKDGENSETLGLSGEETFSLPHLTDQVTPKQVLDLWVKDASGTTRSIEVIARLDTPVEIEYYRNGGILHTVLRQLAKQENP